MCSLLTSGALLEVGLFVSSPDSAPEDASTSPEFQAASDFRCRLAGGLRCLCQQLLCNPVSGLPVMVPAMATASNAPPAVLAVDPQQTTSIVSEWYEQR